MLCPEGAIIEALNVMGVLERGPTPSEVEFARGILKIGEPMAVPIIRQLKKWALPQPGQIVIIDAPPGTSCPVVESVRGADFLLLVTEPTPFGLHDLKLAVGAARILNIPCGLVINRSDLGDDQVKAYTDRENLPVLMEIPYDRRIAEAYSRGELIVEAMPEWKMKFCELYQKIRQLVDETKSV